MFGRGMGSWYSDHVKPIDEEPASIVRLRRSGLEFTAMRLLWGTWSEMCDFANVGIDTEKMCIGVFVDVNGEITESANGRLGLRIPLGPVACTLAVERDWVVKGPQGELFPVADGKLEHLFEIEDG